MQKIFSSKCTNTRLQCYNWIIDGQNFFDQPVKSYINDKVQKIAIGQRDVYTTAS